MWITEPTSCISRCGSAANTKTRNPGFVVGNRRLPGCRWFRRRLPILRHVRRGILGGTFDPPHLAHLFAGEAAYRDLSLDVVTFLPAGSPWQKADRRVTSADDRWAMTVLAIEGVPYFEADDREVRRDGWTYTVDTLRSFPESDELFLIVGADTARGIPTWNEAEEVLRRSTAVVIPRPGVDRSDVDESLQGGDYVWLDTPDVRLSGTMLRRQASAGRSIRFLVREPVWRYVQEHGIYVE